MKTKILLAFHSTLFCFSICLRGLAQDTAFTYQGRLVESGNSANGNYDLRFTLFDADSGGALVAGPIFNSLIVSNGLFTTAVDFGDGAFQGDPRWLEIAVRTNASERFWVLTPRQPVSPTPYALYAPSAGIANVAHEVSPGSISTAALAPDAVDSTRIADGTISAVDLSPGLLSGTFWNLGGNAGTAPGGSFLGTTDNQPLEFRVNRIRALRLEPTANVTVVNVIEGSPYNVVPAGTVGATIGGGGGNYMGGYYTNRVDADFGTVSGGMANKVLANSINATIGGGYANIIQASGHATIAGGYNNVIQPDSFCGTVSGGYENTLQSYSATIGGGFFNIIESDAMYANIAGGADNRIESVGSVSTISGGAQNTIQTNAQSATIAGGQLHSIQGNAHFATISGGIFNTVQSNAGFAAIAGGSNNVVQRDAAYATIGGGGGNLIQTNALFATIGGGECNIIQSNAQFATIGGGYRQRIQTNSFSATIAGGYNNNIGPGASEAAIGGGMYNEIQTNSAAAAIGGGIANTIMPNALRATVGGGYLNTVQPGAQYATIPGGNCNIAGGSYSFAAGCFAQATNSGSFVWSDNSSSTYFNSTANNQFNIRAVGGVRILTGYPNGGLQVLPGGTAWTSLSDRDAKKNFRPVDSISVLDKLASVPIEQWNYNWEEDSATPNLGPMAQDFKAAFYPGRDDKGISTLEFDGVELAAIQGLNLKLEAQMKDKQQRIEALEKQMAELKRIVEKLQAQPKGGAL